MVTAFFTITPIALFLRIVLLMSLLTVTLSCRFAIPVTILRVATLVTFMPVLRVETFVSVMPKVGLVAVWQSLLNLTFAPFVLMVGFNVRLPKNTVFIKLLFRAFREV